MMTKQEQLRQARLERVRAAISLQEGDRVPFIPKTGAFPATAYGLSQYDLMKDSRNLIPCLRRYLADYQPDVVWPTVTYPMDSCELLGAEYIRFPGFTHGLPLDSGFQIMDGTYLEDDEFDDFLLDPTHFMMTRVFPRKYQALKPLSAFYGREIYDLTVMMELAAFGRSDMKEAFERLLRAGEICARRAEETRLVNDCIVELGFPLRGGTILAPFDAYADSLRGLIRAVMDVKEFPDEVLAVTQRIEEMNTDRAIAAAKARGDLFLYIPLHAAGDEFMSNADYATFYWPGLKRTIEKIIAAGITPYVFCEGKYSTRLEFLKDVPPGKVVYMFEQIDIVRAKRELEGIACVCGNLSTTLLLIGSPEQVVDETKRMLDQCAPGGGFIMDCSIVVDTANPKNFAAWQETALTYGQY